MTDAETMKDPELAEAMVQMMPDQGLLEPLRPDFNAKTVAQLEPYEANVLQSAGSTRGGGYAAEFEAPGDANFDVAETLIPALPLPSAVQAAADLIAGLDDQLRDAREKDEAAIFQAASTYMNARLDKMRILQSQNERAAAMRAANEDTAEIDAAIRNSNSAIADLDAAHPGVVEAAMEQTRRVHLRSIHDVERWMQESARMTGDDIVGMRNVPLSEMPITTQDVGTMLLREYLDQHLDVGDGYAAANLTDDALALSSRFQEVDPNAEAEPVMDPEIATRFAGYYRDFAAFNDAVAGRERPVDTEVPSALASGLRLKDIDPDRTNAEVQNLREALPNEFKEAYDLIREPPKPLPPTYIEQRLPFGPPDTLVIGSSTPPPSREDFVSEITTPPEGLPPEIAAASVAADLEAARLEIMSEINATLPDLQLAPERINDTAKLSSGASTGAVEGEVKIDLNVNDPGGIIASTRIRNFLTTDVAGDLNLGKNMDYDNE